MKEKKTDRRVERTQALLRTAFLELIMEKGYDAVTVQDIIDRANVGRSTFYAHFSDKDQVLLKDFRQLRTAQGIDGLDDLIQTDAGGKIVVRLVLFFEHVAEQGKLAYVLMGQRGGDRVTSHLQKELTTRARAQLAANPNCRLPTKQVEVVAHFIGASVVTMLRWWIDKRMSIPARQMAEWTEALIQTGIAQ